MKGKALGSISIVCLIMLFHCSQHKSPEVVPEWADILLTAKGIGAPPTDAESEAQAKLMAFSAAKMDAYRQLEEQAYGIKIDAQTSVQNYIAQSDEIKAKASGFIKGAKIIGRKENSDGSCEVTVQLYLGKEFVEIIREKKY